MKARNLPVGTIREWKGKSYIKDASGKWKPKTGGKGAEVGDKETKQTFNKGETVSYGDKGKFEPTTSIWRTY